MPIKIPEDLPARPILEGENIFVMTEGRANRQDIRPLEIAIVNLMPTKIATETQLLRLLGNTPLCLWPVPSTGGACSSQGILSTTGIRWMRSIGGMWPRGWRSRLRHITTPVTM